MVQFSDQECTFVTSVSHQGKIIAFATSQELGGSAPQIISYRVLKVRLDDANTKEIDEAIDKADWGPIQTLKFSTQIRHVGMSLLTYANDVLDETVNPPTPIPSCLLTANREFQVVSDSKSVFIFRQSANNTLLADEFMLTVEPGESTDNQSSSMAYVLMPKWEVRFKRSGFKDIPASQKDNPGYKSMDGEPFIEPSHELSLVNNLNEGRFCVSLVPTEVMGVQMWHIFFFNNATGVQKMQLVSIPRTTENAFDLEHKLVSSAKVGAEMSFSIDNGTMLYRPNSVLYSKQEHLNSDQEDVENELGMKLKRGYRLMLANAIQTDARTLMQIEFFYQTPLMTPVYNQIQCFVEFPSTATLSPVTGSPILNLSVGANKVAVDWTTKFSFNVQLSAPGSITIYAGGILQTVGQLGVWVNDNNDDPTETLWVTPPYQLQGNNAITIPIANTGTDVTIKIEPMDLGTDGENNNLVYSISQPSNNPVAIMDFGIGKDGSLVRFENDQINLGETQAVPDSTGQIQIKEPMSQLYEDDRGLTLEGTVLTFIDAADSPTLLSASDGVVRLYQQTKVTTSGTPPLPTAANFAVATFNPEMGRALKRIELNSNTGQLAFMANKLGAQYTTAIIAPSDLNLKSGYNCNLEIKVPAYDFESGEYWISEYWNGLPRRADLMARILNGEGTDDVNNPALRSGKRLFYDFMNKRDQLYIVNQSATATDSIGVLTFIPRLLKSNSNQSTIQISNTSNTTCSVVITNHLMPLVMNSDYSVWSGYSQINTIAQTYNNVPKDTTSIMQILNGEATTGDDNSSWYTHNFNVDNAFIRFLIGGGEVIFISSLSGYQLKELAITVIDLNTCDLIASFESTGTGLPKRLVVEGAPRVPGEFIKVMQGTSANFDYANNWTLQTQSAPSTTPPAIITIVTNIWNFLIGAGEEEEADPHPWPVNTSANVSGFHAASSLVSFNNGVGDGYSEFNVDSGFISIFPHLPTTTAYVYPQANIVMNNAAGLINQAGEALSVEAVDSEDYVAFFASYDESELRQQTNAAQLNTSRGLISLSTAASISTDILVGHGNVFGGFLSSFLSKILLKNFTFNNITLSTSGALQNLSFTIKDSSSAVVVQFSILEVEKISTLFDSNAPIGNISKLEFITAIKTSASQYDLQVDFPIPFVFDFSSTDTYTVELSAVDSVNPLTATPITYGRYATVAAGGTLGFLYSIEYIPLTNVEYELWTDLSGNANLLIQTLRGKNLQYNYSGKTGEQNITGSLANGSVLVRAEHSLLVESFVQKMTDELNIESLALPLYEGTDGAFNLNTAAVAPASAATITASTLSDFQQATANVEHLTDLIKENRRTLFYTAFPEISTANPNDAKVGVYNVAALPTTFADLESINFYGVPTTIDCGNSASLNPSTNNLTILLSFGWPGSSPSAPATWMICTKGTFGQSDFCYDVRLEKNATSGRNFLIFRVNVKDTTTNTWSVKSSQIGMGSLRINRPLSAAFTVGVTNSGSSGSVTLNGYIIQPTKASQGLLYSRHYPVTNDSFSNASANYALNNPDPAPSFIMGGGGYFSLNGVQVWSVALAQADIMANIIFGGSTATGTGLVAFWPFTEQQGLEVSDSVSNNNGELASERMWADYVPPSIQDYVMNNWEAGYLEKAIQLLSGECITYPTPTSTKNLDAPGDLMMEAWVKAAFPSGTANNTEASIINYGRSEIPSNSTTPQTISNYSLGLLYDSTSANYKVFATKGGKKITTVNAIPSPSNWHNIAAYYRSGYSIVCSPNNYATLGKQNLNPGSEGFTLSCWFKFNAFGSAVLMSKRRDAGACYELSVTSSGNITFKIYFDAQNAPSNLASSPIASNSSLSISYSQGLVLNQWTHIAIAVQFQKDININGSNSNQLSINCYLNFQSVGTRAYLKTNSSSSPNDNFIIDFATSDKELVAGISNTNLEMAGIQYWNIGLDRQQIVQNSKINSQPSGDGAKGLVSFWPCSDGEGKTLSDVQQINDGQLSSVSMWTKASIGAETGIYVDGQIQQVVESVITPSTTSQFSLGGILSTATPPVVNSGFIGDFSEIRIWNVIRTLEELLDNMYTQLDGSEQGLSMYLGYKNLKNDLKDLSPGALSGSFFTPNTYTTESDFYLNIREVEDEDDYSNSWRMPQSDITVRGSIIFSSTIKLVSKVSSNGNSYNDQTWDAYTNFPSMTYTVNVPGTVKQKIIVDFKLSSYGYWDQNSFEILNNSIEVESIENAEALYTGSGWMSHVWQFDIEPGNNVIEVRLRGDTYSYEMLYNIYACSSEVSTTPNWQATTGIPIGEDIPQISTLPTARTNNQNTIILGQPTVLEYGDLQLNDKGDLIAILKRFYAYLDTSNKVNLVTGFKVGEADLSFIGQVQTNPTLKGFIEGAPPVPSENLTENDKSDIGGAFTPVDDFDGSSSISLEKEKGDHRTYTVSDESGYDFSSEGWAGVEVKSEDSVGMFFTHQITDVSIKAGLAWNVAGSNSKTSEETQGTDFDDTETNQAIYQGHWEIPKDYNQDGNKDWLLPELGKRYIASNVGYALVESETADMFALKMKKNGAVIGYQIMPNPNIPKDKNIIMFPINPEYTKFSTLDGMVGTLPDPIYPSAKYGERGSYFKPIEAYALKARIQRDREKILAYYAQMDPQNKGVQGDIKLPDWVNSLANRDMVNNYVWTAKGGFFAESEQYATTRLKVQGGTRSLEWNLGVKAEGAAVIGIVGPFFELDAMAGHHSIQTVIGENQKTSVLNMEVEVEGNRWLREWDWNMKDYLEKDAPGKVESYRFMSFYLSPKRDNFDAFFDSVVDENWLYNSATPDAIALLEAKGQKVPVWRSFHRVTYVKRVPPAFELFPTEDTPPSVQKPVNLDSNAWLIHLVSNALDNPATATPAEIGEKIESILNTPTTGTPAVDNPEFLGYSSPWWQAFHTAARTERLKNKQLLQIIRNCKTYMISYFETLRLED